MLHLTPTDLRAMYDLIRGTSPFKGWRLPEGDDVEFHFVKMRGQDQADCYENGKGRHVIRLAANKHHTLASSITTMAHEMVHLHLDKSYPRDRAHHGHRFQKHADIVCKHHGFDRGQF